MTDDIQKLKDDIEFMRSLTHESSDTAQREGHVLIAVGLIFGLIYACWLLFRIELGALTNWIKWAWITGPIALVVFVTALGRRPPATGAATRAMSAARVCLLA